MSVLVMIIMAKIHEEIAQPFLEHIDRYVLQSVHAEDTPALTRLAFILTFIGSPTALIPGIAIAATVLWRIRLRHDAVLLVAAIGGAALIDTVLKLHFRRLRPNVPWHSSPNTAFRFPADTPSAQWSSTAPSPTSYGVTCTMWPSALPSSLRRCCSSAALDLAGFISGSTIPPMWLPDISLASSGC